MRKHTTAIMAFALALGISIPVTAQTPSTSPTSQPSAAPAQTQPAQGQATPQTAAPPQKDPVAEALNLTDEQQAKLQPIIREEMAQINAVHNDTSMTPEQKQQRVDQIRQTEFPKIQAILTPEQQKKLAAMQEQARQRANQGNVPAATPGNPPQKPQQ